MVSELGFVASDNLLAKLILDSKLQPELDDPDVVERCPKDRYIRYNELLGRGAFKTVYKGFDEVEGIEVAWSQVMLDDNIHSPSQIERIYSEVHLLKTLKHVNVIKSYVSWVDDDKKTIHMITELFTSGNLRQYRKKHKSVDLKAIKNWARQILQGLVYLHSHEPPIIHRDLKCDNIFVNGNHGQVKIGDLGLATLMLRPTAKSLIGTPEFMAPELYEEEYNELVDIYSFGMCLLELITCEYPYSECKNQAQIYKKVTSGIKPAALSKVKDPKVKEFIEKCLVPVSQRLSANELLKDPFLAVESINENVDEDDLVNLSLFPMDIDFNDEIISSVNSSVNESNNQFSSHELQCVNERNDLRLKGELNEDNTVTLNLRIADLISGGVRRIEFPFSLSDDTAHTIAQEMVEELDLLHEDVIIIAELIDDMIMKFVPTWIPSFVKQQSISSSHEDSTNVSEPEHNSSGVYSFDSINNIASNCSVSREDEEDLEKEIENIEAEYRYLSIELQKRREAAIEDAKKKWINKKNVDSLSSV